MATYDKGHITAMCGIGRVCLPYGKRGCVPTVRQLQTHGKEDVSVTEIECSDRARLARIQELEVWWLRGNGLCQMDPCLLMRSVSG